MSTHAAIGIRLNDGRIKAIYCHFDGYVQHIGKMLTTHFNSMEKAVELVNEGELRSVDVDKDGNVELEHFVEDFEKREIEYYDTMEDMLNAFRNSDREFIYLWDDEFEGWVYREMLYTENGKAINDWMPVIATLIELNV